MAGTLLVNTATIVDADTGAFVGMTGSDGKPYLLNQPAIQALVSTPGNADAIAFVGDSIASLNVLPITASAITDNGNGTGTVAGASLLTFAGETITLLGSPTASLNQLNTTVLSHTLTGANVTSLTFAINPSGYVNRAQSGTLFLYKNAKQCDRGFLSFGVALAEARARVIAGWHSAGADSIDMEPFVAAAIALRPKAIAIQLGTNNVFARGYSAAVTIASFKRIIDPIAAAGIVPMVASILPRSDGQQSAANSALSAPVNRWLADYLPKVGGVYVPTWRSTANGLAFADPSSTIGLATSTMLVDGVHQGRRGAFAMGKAWATALRTVFRAPVARNHTPQDVALSGKWFFDNTLLTGSGGTNTPGSGTITGTIPTGVAVINNGGVQVVVCSVIARTEAADGDLVGNKLRLAITGITSATSITVRAALSPTNWAHGDLLQGAAVVSVSSGSAPGTGVPTNIATPELLINVSTATTGADFLNACANQTPELSINEAYTLYLTTPTQALKAAGPAVHGALSFMRIDLLIVGLGVGDASVDISLPQLYSPGA